MNLFFRERDVGLDVEAKRPESLCKGVDDLLVLFWGELLCLLERVSSHDFFYMLYYKLEFNTTYLEKLIKLQ